MQVCIAWPIIALLAYMVINLACELHKSFGCKLTEEEVGAFKDHPWKYVALCAVASGPLIFLDWLQDH